VQELISNKSVSVTAEEVSYDGPRPREEIMMERVMELLLSEAENKRFAYVRRQPSTPYCDLVTALTRKDVQLIYPQIVEGGTLRVPCVSCHASCMCSDVCCTRTAYLEYDLLQNINNMRDSSRQKFDENPEVKILAITLRLLNAVTWDHNSLQFTKLWLRPPPFLRARYGVCGDA
jgi:hypothetical protein